MKARCFLLLPIAAILTGCVSYVPVAQNFERSYQKVARTAHHWDVVAEDVVRQTMESIAKREELQGRSVYVAPTRSTAFNTAFREFMITRLVADGASVSVCKSEDTTGFSADRPDLEVHYDSQVIVHGFRPPSYVPGLLTALAGGVAVVRNVPDIGANTALVGGAALVDLAHAYLPRPTRTEIIVTTTIIDSNRFVARSSDVYYVPDGDAQLFIQAVAPRSRCADGVAVAVGRDSKAGDEGRAENARREMFERAMLRSNPLWRPNRTSAQSAYSY